jgi:hypothetical protein
MIESYDTLFCQQMCKQTRFAKNEMDMLTECNRSAVEFNGRGIRQHVIPTDPPFGRVYSSNTPQNSVM